MSLLKVDTAVPLDHTLIAAPPPAQANPVFQGMAGPAGLHMQLAPIIGLSAPGMLRAYYLSYQPGKFGNTNDLNLTERVDSASSTGRPVHCAPRSSCR